MTMEVYLVGGAVRDELLGQIVHERDWVVVGATPHQLIELGYQQVGRDFPVFLHPMTKEEYALARTERKSGVGYHGFECQYSPEVSLEEDLKRRDLTINAMALTDDGHVIDPFGGMRDLKLKKLRHVSEAFIEDPLRVLRVARFMARFHHLGFKIATETKILMRRMVEAHELSYLVPERVWQEWKKSLETQNPECFLQTLYDCGALNRVLPELMILFDAEGLPAWQALASSIQNGASPVISFAVLMMARSPSAAMATIASIVCRSDWPSLAFRFPEVAPASAVVCTGQPGRRNSPARTRSLIVDCLNAMSSLAFRKAYAVCVTFLFNSASLALASSLSLAIST